MTQIEIKPNGSRPSAKGPAQTFTGSVIVDPLFDASEHTHSRDERRQIQPRDVIWISPDVKNWHGATATNRMRHIAFTNVLNGKMVDWLEHVSEAEYRAQA
jgi:hypothetical protein